MHKIATSVGDSILIGEDIRITVIGVQGSHTWIDIKAPEGKLRIGNEEPIESRHVNRESLPAPLISGNWITEDETDLAQ